MKKLLSIFAVAFFALILGAQNIIPVAAAEPNTYLVEYNDEKDDWYYTPGSPGADDETPQKREIYYLLQILKDGDYIVVDSTKGTGTLKLDFTLGNLTILPNSSALITCKGVQEYYQLHDSTVSLFANVEKAFVYDNAVVNFNNNVNTLELIFEGEPTMVAHVMGTCKDFIVHNPETTLTHLWNFREPLLYNQGVLSTAYGTYDINPPAAPAAPIVSTTPSSTPTATPSAPSSSADEYDDVPKTGESAAFLWIFALAALCFAGSYSFKKKF